MKMPAFIKNLLKRLGFVNEGSNECTNECEPYCVRVIRYVTMSEYAEQYGLPFHAFRSRVARRLVKAKKAEPDRTFESSTSINGRLVRTYDVEFLAQVAEGLRKKATGVATAKEHEEVGERIKRLYEEGAHDLIDFCHCSSHVCTHDVCKSCLRNPRHFPGSVMTMYADAPAVVRDGKCTHYCGFTASMHARHVLYGVCKEEKEAQA